MNRRERQQLLERLRGDARRIAAHFELEYKAIEAESMRVKSRYGVCYEDGLIKIRLHNVRTGRALKYSSLIDTLCHELAHLVHFNHGPQFKAYFLKLLGWARQQGIYQPDLRRARKLARGRARQQALAQQPAPLPERRNGVPVFAEAGVIDAANLWQRLARHAGDDSLAARVAAPVRPPAPSPSTPRPPAPTHSAAAAARRRPRARPQVQFALFSEGNGGSPSGAPRRSARRAPRRERPAQREQLGLFE